MYSIALRSQTKGIKRHSKGSHVLSTCIFIAKRPQLDLMDCSSPQGSSLEERFCEKPPMPPGELCPRSSLAWRGKHKDICFRSFRVQAQGHHRHWCKCWSKRPSWARYLHRREHKHQRSPGRRPGKPQGLVFFTYWRGLRKVARKYGECQTLVWRGRCPCSWCIQGTRRSSPHTLCGCRGPMRPSYADHQDHIGKRHIAIIRWE